MQKSQKYLDLQQSIQVLQWVNVHERTESVNIALETDSIHQLICLGACSSQAYLSKTSGSCSSSVHCTCAGQSLLDGFTRRSVSSGQDKRENLDSSLNSQEENHLSKRRPWLISETTAACSITGQWFWGFINYTFSLICNEEVTWFLKFSVCAAL